MDYVIGVDVGGTNVRIGLVDRELHLIEKHSSPLINFEQTETFLDYIKEEVAQLNEVHSVHKIGIVIPAPITVGLEKIEDATNVPFLNGYSFDKIRAHFPNSQIFIENDVNVIALLESRFGEAKDFHNSLYITVSTGIGSGVIVSNQIVHGANGYAGEVGAIPMRSWIPWEVEKKKYSSLEKLCSGKALDEVAKSHFHLSHAKALFEQYQKNNEIRDFLNLWIENLSAGFAASVQVLDPDIVILGGGVITHNPWLVELLAQKTKEKLFKKMSERLVFKMTMYNEDAGLLGAANLCIE